MQKNNIIKKSMYLILALAVALGAVLVTMPGSVHAESPPEKEFDFSYETGDTVDLSKDIKITINHLLADPGYTETQSIYFSIFNGSGFSEFILGLSIFDEGAGDTFQVTLNGSTFGGFGIEAYYSDMVYIEDFYIIINIKELIMSEPPYNVTGIPNDWIITLPDFFYDSAFGLGFEIVESSPDPDTTDPEPTDTDGDNWQNKINDWLGGSSGIGLLSVGGLVVIGFVLYLVFKK